MRVEGLDNILRNLAKLDPKEWKRDAMKRMRDGHKTARADMRNSAPKGETGKLRRSIRTQAWMKKQKGGEVGIFVRTGPKLYGKGRVWYAHYPELGTNKTEAQHFILKTYNTHAERLRKDMLDIVEDVVRKAEGQ